MSESEWTPVEQARDLPGLRLVLTAGVPGPWGEAAKGLFHVKKIPYVPVPQAGGAANDALEAWTGFDNAPQAVWEGERARITSTEIILLAERLVPEPALIPADPRERAEMFGLVHELAAEMGFGWCRRLQLLHPAMQLPEPPEIMKRLAAKYYTADVADQADGRVRDILALFTDQLRRQREAGSDFLVGQRLSAADIYFAAFAAMIEPLPADQCAMQEFLRAGYTLDPAAFAADPSLLAHRDRIYREYMELPIRL